MAEPTEPTDAAGAQVEEVEVTDTTPAATGNFTMEVVTTAPGTFGIGGIEPIGKRARIECGAYSKLWMKAATKSDAMTYGRFVKWRDNQAKKDAQA